LAKINNALNVKEIKEKVSLLMAGNINGSVLFV
jgi:hypothetical protein